MNRPIASVTAAGMLLLIGLALPPPGTADDKTPPDQSSDVTERGVGGVMRPKVAPLPEMFLEVPPSPPTPRPDLIGRKISSNGCGPGRVGMALIELKNQGTTLAGAFFTEVNSFSKLIRFRMGQLPPGGAFARQVQVGCPPQGPCPVNGRIDMDGEVAESNETNNVISFTCP
jgi:hypothetical protein